jgi:hypothetical protein
MIRFLAILGTTALVTLACASQNDGPLTSDPGQNQTGQTVMDPEAHMDPTIRRLEQEAMALAKTDGCTIADQCRMAPIGSRACGGPRYYLPYCRLTTDSAALFAKLEEIKRAEEEYNRRNQIGSTCEYRLPPAVELAGGACRAKTAP